MSLEGSIGEPLRLEIDDGGTGISHPDAVDRGASTGDSSGLGLDIVRRIAEASGGSLELTTSTRLGGARVVVTLPRR
jgi:signal transduction histidine kinase